MNLPIFSGIRETIFRRDYVQLDRSFLSRKFIKGEGIEIGALHNPLPIFNRYGKVKYVDRMSVPELRQQYPELNEVALVQVDIISNGELLESINSKTQDFVIANHLIEHCQDPILALKNMLRVLRPGGIVYLAVPDKRFTFDSQRPVTTINHLVDDYQNGSSHSKRAHFEEWCRLVCNLSDETEIQKKMKELMDLDYSIHFHVWTKTAMDKFLLYLITELYFGFEIELAYRVEKSIENIYILRKFRETA